MLLQGSDRSEARMLFMIGAALVLCVVAVLGAVKVLNPFGGRAPGLISVVIDTPFVGEGVAKGTPIVLHGVKVGEVTGVASLPAGGVQLNADLQSGPVTGLTNTMDIDFRPVNYFGVTGINLVASTGGQPLSEGMRIRKAPNGNFTLQALLYRFGQLSTGVLTTQLVQVIDRSTRYIDALDPLLETMLIVSNAVAGVQTVSTEQLLTNTTQLSNGVPSFVAGATQGGEMYINLDRTYAGFGPRDVGKQFFDTRGRGTIRDAIHVFGDVGTLEQTHVDDLLPVIDTVKALADVVPPLIRPDGIAQTLVELRSRFEKLYSGTPGQPALNVQIALDNIPSVAGPLGIEVGHS
ncbi:Mammalian cell entry related domain protein [Mycobacterium arosiense]|uniref:Mammalian cell entry related domain protein n=1 Tax=Mycobacterium arosiense ATCC BAA-1401 = DSM 45069 TaxID=1265311 RepID=A0A1W9ZBG4_MYCAI|nr:Mammalian cell entry related domain protein [Mycobacterium arosiense]ORA11291.1 Mammalian cell entry related domain protein [Mycobacterium arosiense ATCC BAA-1401 = DSM 45069]